MKPSNEHFTVTTDGVFIPYHGLSHRDDEYASHGHDVLWDMQMRHFWYLGRNRFLLYAFRRAMGEFEADRGISTIDLGGGCGGWVKLLHEREGGKLHEIALGDSSLGALRRAGSLLPPDIARYQVDVCGLPWTERWDIVTCLDVIEHIPDEDAVLSNIHRALKHGGVALLATPALRCFWSACDDDAHHLRRYSRPEMAELARRNGFLLLDCRYFMFFLSPLLWMSRVATRVMGVSEERQRQMIAKSHRVPGRCLNTLLATVFRLETPVGFHLRFPWGTSLLTVLKKR